MTETPLLKRVVEMLSDLRRRPMMFACTREAFAAQVATLLAVADIASAFVYDVFKVPGSCVYDASILSPVDDNWARALIDDVAARTGLELEL